MSSSENRSQFFDVNVDRDTVAVRFKSPRLTDDDNIEQLGHELFGLVDQHDTSRILLDLGGVTLISSSVLGKLITLHRRLHRTNGMLVICNTGEHVTQILRTSRLHDYFNVASDSQAAFQMLGQFDGED